MSGPIRPASGFNDPVSASNSPVSDSISPQRSYQLLHTTVYSYDAEVSASYGQAHLTLSESPQQRVAHSELVIDPPPSEMEEHQDFFGNTSTFFIVTVPHTSLSVTARSAVSIDRPTSQVSALAAISLQEAKTHAAQDASLTDFMLPSPRVALSAQVRAYAAEIFRDAPSIGTAITQLLRAVHEDFRYRSGATTVLSDVEHVLASRAGVCQDFAHLSVACLRSAGLAARYVSGYLETRPAPGRQKLQGADATHAWASVYAPEVGWVDFDPTNNQYVDSRYLVAAVGRDYGDVPPLKGVIVTSATHSTLRVSVDVTRIS